MASELRQLEEQRLQEQQETSSTLLRLIKRMKNMEEKFRSTRNSAQVRCQELEDRERRIGDETSKLDVLKAETENKAVELRSLEKLIQERQEEAVKGESHLESLKLLIQEHEEELEFKEKRFSDLERMIGVKEGECESVQKRMKESLEKLNRVEKEIEEKIELKQKLSRTMEVKGKVFCLHKTSMKEWSRKLEVKGRELEELSKKIELKEKQFEPRVEEIRLIEKRVNECLNEIVLKERHLQSLEKSIQERENLLEEREKRLDSVSHGLEMREKELDLKAKELELKQYERAPGSLFVKFAHLMFDRSISIALLASNVISSLIKVGEPKSLLAKKAAVSSSSSNPQLSDSLNARNLQGQVTGNDFLENQFFDNLQSSLDPAKLVLDWMQTYLSQYWTKGDVGFEVTSIKTYISLLEQLTRLSSQAGAQVKEGAMKLAVQWKANMRADTENSLEILGFLHFIATFGLLYTLNVDEIVKLLGMISQHKEALELCQTLDFADEIPEFIQTLVERKQLMEAVGLICTFKISDQFPPGPLLEEYMEEQIKCCRIAYKRTKLYNEKVRIVDDQITRLRAVIDMIKNHNLESTECASTNIEMQITRLHQVKENWRLQAANLATVPKRGIKRSSSTLPTAFEPQQQPNKVHRTAVAVPQPPALQIDTPIHPQSDPSSLLLHTGQFGAAQNTDIHYPHSGSSHPQWNHPNHFGR
ncbi:FRIGIDA-like protein 5 [Rosa rugosa]|uniref:FRIGIDA-like protein 5 n=1 Tax=Rosa rugosa TaxID=74645 RepID=UPI002B413DC0|nr:FRIGIDA-like protein 5 [Rosa rugosa]